MSPPPISSCSLSATGDWSPAWAGPLLIIKCFSNIQLSQVSPWTTFTASAFLLLQNHLSEPDWCSAMWMWICWAGPVDLDFESRWQVEKTNLTWKEDSLLAKDLQSQKWSVSKWHWGKEIHKFGCVATCQVYYGHDLLWLMSLQPVVFMHFFPI